MKNNLNIILLVIGCFVLLIGCQQDTFTTDPLIEDIEAPSNLSYFEVLNARENAALKTGVPAINTGGLPPYYEIVSARKADGTILDASYMNDVSIENPIEEEKNLRPEDYYVVDGDTIKTYIGINTSKSGRISIADENQFGIDDYYFTVKVTTFVNDVPKETVFEDVFHLGVGPGLVTNLLYSPIAQNIVVGSGGTTTQPYLITGNPDVTFALGTENQEENLNIDKET